MHAARSAASLARLPKATLVRGVTLTAAQLGSILNFAQVACMAKFKIEPKCEAVKVTPLTEVSNDFYVKFFFNS